MATSVVAPGSSYTVTFFGDPDTTSDSTRGTAINNHGKITGWYNLSGGGVASYTANVVDTGTGTLTVENFVTIPNPTGAGLEAYGINDTGDLVGGTSVDGSPAGFSDVGGSISTVVVPMAVNTTLWGLNDAGDFVGDIATPAGTVKAYVATSSGSSSFSVPGGGTSPYTFAYGINNTQAIVGSYVDQNSVIHGYIDSGVTTTTLDVPGAVGITEAYGINNSGRVSGAYEDAQDHFVPFMYQDGTYTLYENVQAAPFTNVGINDAGQIIGTALVGSRDEAFIINPVIPCYRRGTMIMTVAGEVAVEDLCAGDVVRTLAGEVVAAIWVGHRKVDCRRHPRPCEVWPVCVRAGSFGDGLPHRDLWLSPDHAVFVDDVLIPIKCLINGTSVSQIEMAEITYFHIELDRHDVLLAEGLPAESYLDTGNRSNFSNGGGVAALHSDFASLIWDAKGCAPLVVTGPVFDAIKRRLAERVRFGQVGIGGDDSKAFVA